MVAVSTPSLLRDLDDLSRLSDQIERRTAARDALLARLHAQGCSIADLVEASRLPSADVRRLTSTALRMVTTIGYEGRDVDTFVAELVANGVTVVVDVRETPLSRKAGFSKNALRTALGGAGVGYEHLRGLGNPKDNREGFRAGQPTAIRRFESRLTGPGADDLKTLRSTITGERAALLCFERDHRTCHRSSITAALQREDQALHVVNI